MAIDPYSQAMIALTLAQKRYGQESGWGELESEYEDIYGKEYKTPFWQSKWIGWNPLAQGIALFTRGAGKERLARKVAIGREDKMAKELRAAIEKTADTQLRVTTQAIRGQLGQAIAANKLATAQTGTFRTGTAQEQNVQTLQTAALKDIGVAAGQTALARAQLELQGLDMQQKYALVSSQLAAQAKQASSAEAGNLGRMAMMIWLQGQEKPAAPTDYSWLTALLGGYNPTGIPITPVETPEEFGPYLDEMTYPEELYNWENPYDWQ